MVGALIIAAIAGGAAAYVYDRCTGKNNNRL